MKRALQQIVEVTRGNRLYYMSVAEKQNDSGIMFNQRILFLLAQNHIGYLSEVNMQQTPKDVNFQKSKATILLANIKTVSVNQKQLTIKYVMIDSNNKKSDRIWLFRMQSDKLAYRWYETIQRQKINIINKKQKSSDPKDNRESIIKDEYKPNPVQKSLTKSRKSLSIVHNVEVSSFLKKEKQVKDIGTGVSPKNSQIEKKRTNSDRQQQLSRILGNSGVKRSDVSQNKSKNIQDTSKQEKSMYEANPNSIDKKLLNKSKKLQDEKGIDDNHLNQTNKKTLNKSQKLQDASRQDRSMYIIKGNLNSTDRKSENKSQKIQDMSRQNRSMYAIDGDLNSIDRRSVNKNNLNNSALDKDESILNSKEINSSFGNKKDKTSLSNKKYLQDNKSNSLNLSQELLRSQTKNYNPAKNAQLNESKIQINLNPMKNTSIHSNTSQIHFKQLSHQIPWTYKYIKHNYFIYNEFKEYTKQLMQDLINNFKSSDRNKKYKPKLIKNGIHYFDINDVEVKVATISLEDASIGQKQPNKQKVCNKNAVKLIQNEFNNFVAIHEYLQNNAKLKVPLISLCEYNGFIALFKVMSQNCMKPYSLKQIEGQLSLLKAKSKINHNFNFNLNKVIILLNEAYYQSLKQKGDEQLNFYCYIIQQIDEYLPLDLISQQSSPQLTIYRKQLIQIHGLQQLNHKKQSENQFSEGPRWQISKISKAILKAISDIVISMNALQCYFMNSNEFSQFLHQKGVNIRYIGHIYRHITTPYQRKFLMTQIAARSCKSLFRKTVQDMASDQAKLSSQDIRLKVCDFMNCIVGNTYETAAIWKVLSTHSIAYFGVQLNFDQIDRGYFLISLIQNCRLDVFWQRLKAAEIFNSNIFFNDKNLRGLLSKQKTYPFIYSEQYQAVCRILEKQQNSLGFDKFVKDLNLKKYPIPQHLISLKPKINKYLCYFINPQKAETQCNHLGIFGSQEKVCPSRLIFDGMLTEIKWWLKLKNKQNYIKVCNDFINLVTRFYGQFHPIFSELYDIFSAYHLTCSEYEDAITFAKSSLVNILKILGTNHERTSECYYHLALCYIKAGRRDQAIAHIKKTKFIFQNNGKSETLPYAIMSIKLGLLYLNQNQIQDCLNTTSHALSILQKTDVQTQQQYEDQMVECYEVLTRCFQLTQSKLEMRQIAQQCFAKLKSMRSASNIQKALKICLYPLLTELSPEKASCLIDMISLMPQQSNENDYFTAFKLLSDRIQQESLISSLQLYLQKLIAIQKRVRSENILSQWVNFKQIYERETFRDFISLTSELIAFLGQGFLQGTLREAL